MFQSFIGFSKLGNKGSSSNISYAIHSLHSYGQVILPQSQFLLLKTCTLGVMSK